MLSQSKMGIWLFLTTNAGEEKTKYGRMASQLITVRHGYQNCRSAKTFAMNTKIAQVLFMIQMLVSVPIGRVLHLLFIPLNFVVAEHVTKRLGVIVCFIV